MSGQSDEPDEVVGARIRQNWFTSVYDISDLALQRRMWLDPAHGNPYWSYTEFVCEYPDHNCLADALKRGWITTAEFTVLSELEQAIQDYTAPGAKAAIPDDPAWQAVETALERVGQEPLSELTSTNELAQAFVNYMDLSGKNYDHAAILDDPAWQAVVATAQRVTQELLSTVTSPIERQILLGSKQDLGEAAS
jgi:hypothetical protein